MNKTFLHHVLQAAEQLAAKERLGSLGDADLWQRFAQQQDEAAFALIVRRHGALVWGICRQLLAREADAEDAFQATFLAFVRSANKVQKPHALASWFHGVAYRVAMKARRTTARRLKREGEAAQTEATAPVADEAWDQLQRAVHEEVYQLPETLRTPFVLCCLQGTPQQEAAQQLGWKLGTLSGRLTKARQTLLDRLVRRGIALGAATGTSVLSGFSAAAPPDLVEQTASFVQPTTVPSSINYLAQGVTTVYFTRFKLTIAAVLVVGLLTCSVRYGFFSTADAQDRYTPTPVVKTPAAKAFWEYKLVPRTKTYTSKEFLALLNDMEAQGAWEYCGTQPLNESVTGGTQANEHLVFKRRVAIVQNDPTAEPTTKLGIAAHELAVLQKQKEAQLAFANAAIKDAERQREESLARERAALLFKKAEAEIIVLEAELQTTRARSEVLVNKYKVAQDTGDTKTTNTLRAEIEESDAQMKAAQARLGLAKVTYERLTKDVKSASTPTPSGVISKISEVYRSADVKPVDDIQIVRLKYAAAADLGKVLQDIVMNVGSTKLRVVTDDRTNSLILSGPANDIDTVKNLIKQLDTADKVKR